jgi:hypothetical protein
VSQSDVNVVNAAAKIASTLSVPAPSAAPAVGAGTP